MGQKSILSHEPGILPPLEPGFLPVSLGDMAYLKEAEKNGFPVKIAYERENGLVARGDTFILPQDHPNADNNIEFLLDRITAGVVHNGAHTVWFDGPKGLGSMLQMEFIDGPSEPFFGEDGSRKWVAIDLAGTSYDKPFEIKIVGRDDVPDQNETSAPLGGGLEGRRIGFDLGASDFKVSAFDGKECVFSHEFPWNPKSYTDPRHHHAMLLGGLMEAAAKLGYNVDAMGGSSAGVWVNNRLKIGSIARGVVAGKNGQDIRAAMDNLNEWLVDETGGVLNVEPVIINDGNVTALAGHLFIPGANGVIGIAMGSDEAGGYAYPKGKMDTKLYEWAFWRIDRGKNAPVEEWSKLKGIGGMYFGQRAWNRLYVPAGISHEEVGGENAPIPDKLVKLQELVEKGDERAILIPKTIGIELGYSIMPYVRDCGEVSHVLVLGRCMRGKSGDIILEEADGVLKAEFNESYKFQLFNPDAPSFAAMVGGETAKRFKTLGQSMAAATLPPKYK